MSEVVSIVVYYGYGTVRTNESGVDLSEFVNVEIPLTERIGRASCRERVFRAV